MGSIFHEFKHSVKSKTFVGLLILVIVFSVIGTYGFTVSQINPSNSSPHLDEAYYYQNSSYHVVNYIFDVFGNPLNNVKVSLNLPNISKQSNTNADGFANFTIPVENASIEYQGQIKYSYSGNEYYRNITLNSSYGNFNMYDQELNVITTTPVYKQNDPYAYNLVVFYLGQNGTRYPGIVSLYMQQVSSFLGTTVPAYGNWTFVTNLSNFYVSKINLNIPPQKSSTHYNGAYHSSNGSVVSIFTRLTLSEPTPQTQLSSHAANFIENYYPLFGAIIVWLMVFVIYGRQNISGIIESTVCRPTTRRKIFLARYAATAFLLFLISFIPLAIMSFTFRLYFGFSLTFNSFTTLFEGVFFSMTAFAGIEFIIYSLYRTEVGAFVTSIILAVILSFFWFQIIADVGGALGIGSGYGANVYIAGLNYVLLMYYINPIGLITLSSDAVSGGNFFIPLSWSPYAPTIWTILAVGLIWTVVGFAISYMLARPRD